MIESLGQIATKKQTKAHRIQHYIRL